MQSKRKLKKKFQWMPHEIFLYEQFWLNVFNNFNKMVASSCEAYSILSDLTVYAPQHPITLWNEDFFVICCLTSCKFLLTAYSIKV